MRLDSSPIPVEPFAASTMDTRPANWDHCLDYAVLSDVGMRRANNQDAYAVALASDQGQWQQRGHLFMVADGMGAHVAGEMASKLAVDTVPLSYYKHADLSPAEALRRAVEEANELIHRRGQSSDDFRGMGTTSTAMLLVPAGALVAHVGDSRAYRMRGNVLEQLSFDHSLVWELQASGSLSDSTPNFIPKNIITRSLGPNPSVQVDLEGPFPLQIGDTFLLCSDGLSGQLSDEELGAILASLPPKKAARAMVDLANLRGGPDNITLVIVRVIGPMVCDPQAAARDQRKTPVSPVVWTVLGVLLLASLSMAVLMQWLAAAVAGGAALLTALVAWAGRQTALPRGAPLDGRPLGRGPHVRINAAPSEPVVSALSKVADELESAARENSWQVDWHAFEAMKAQAQTNRQEQHWVEATRDLCDTITFMMEQLRNQGHRQAAGQGNSETAPPE